MLALGASLVLRAAAYSLTEAGEPYNVIAPPKMLSLLANATTHSRVDCGALSALKEAECLKALQHKADKGVDLFQMLQDVSKKEALTHKVRRSPEPSLDSGFRNKLRTRRARC